MRPIESNGFSAGKKESPPRVKAWFSRALRPFLYSLLITAGLFTSYEIVERLWLPQMGGHSLHLLHLVRGIVFSLIVATAVGWLMVRNLPEFLADGATDARWDPGSRPSSIARTRMYARWFIGMRWIAVWLAAILVFISVKVVHWLPDAVWWPLAGAVAVLAGFNVLWQILLSWEQGVAALLHVQGYVDLVILTWLLHFSGGIENPLSMMMIFHVILAGILLSRAQCYWIAAAASGLFAALTWAEWSDAVEHYTLELFPHFEVAGGEMFHPAHHTVYAGSRLVLQTVVLFLTGYFVTTLAERLRANERRLEAMADRALAGQQLLEKSLETTGAGLRVLDGESANVWANRLWNEWFGSAKTGSSTGATPMNALQSSAREAQNDHQMRVMELSFKNGGPGAKADNGDRVFQVTTAPLPQPGDRGQRVVQLAQEITRQKEIQQQMMRAGRLAAAGKLAGQVAHEVNNPISIISAKARLLLTDHREEMSFKVAEELGKITHLSDRVARIAQGLLSYCRLSPGTRAPLDLRQPIRKSLAMIEQHAQRRGVLVEDALPERLPAAVANAPEMEQVFLNLFLNALDAMPGGGRLMISGATGALPDGRPAVAVTVEDTGAGIPEAIRERIFEPFFTTKQEGHGTGLGLSICLGLVNSHGGEIEVENAVAGGSRFTVKLPVSSAVKEEQAHG